MYFDRPVYLWLLVLLPLLWFFLSRYISAGDRVRKMWSKPSLSALLPPHRRDLLAALLVVVGFISLAVALADPYLLRITENPQFRRKNLVFLLDVSPSMNTQDVWPSRIERAKEVIHRFIQRETEVVRFGLVSFSESSVILSYLTSDPQNLLFYLDFLRPDRRILYGTDIGVALSSGLQVLEKQEQREGTDRLRPETGNLLVLLSDGEDHGESLETAIQEAARRGIRVHTVGVGTSQGGQIPLIDEEGKPGYLEDDHGVRLVSKLTVDTLKEIALQTGGKFFQASSGVELESALESILKAEREVTGYQVGSSRQAMFYYFVGGAFFSQLLVLTLRF